MDLHDRLTDALGRLAARPRFGPPPNEKKAGESAVKPRAVPCENVWAAQVLFAELTGADARFGFDRIRSAVGFAAAWLDDPKPLHDSWTQLERALELPRQLLARIPRRQLTELIDHNPGMINTWAFSAWDVTLALDAVEQVVRTLLAELGRPGEWLRAEQFSKVAQVSTTTLHRASAPAAKDPNVAPHRRVGAAKRFVVDDYAPQKSGPIVVAGFPPNSSNPGTDREKPQPSSSSNRQTPHAPPGQIPGTGIRRPW